MKRPFSKRFFLGGFLLGFSFASGKHFEDNISGFCGTWRDFFLGFKMVFS